MKVMLLDLIQTISYQNDHNIGDKNQSDQNQIYQKSKQSK